MQDMAQLSGHAKARIDQLESQGYTLTAEETVRINALSWGVASPGTRMSLSRGIPVFVSGIPLWPLTFEARDWHERIGARLPTYRLQQLALAWAAAHCYDGREAYTTVGPDTAKRVVRNWSKQLRCRRATLTEALSQIIQQDEEEYVPPHPGSDKGGMSPGDMALMLSAMTGRPAREYEQEMSASAAIRMSHYALIMQDRADKKSTAHGAEADALRALEYYIIQLKEKRNGA